MSGPLSLDEIRTLTSQDFDFIAEASLDGSVTISPAQETLLVQVLSFFGLRRPVRADAFDIAQLCSELRWTYGQAVRLAARNRLDIHVACPQLSAEQLDYARAVGSQNQHRARAAARRVFKELRHLPFLC